MRRGQATVELALGLLVIVPMLLAGIYLAEYAQLSLKVQDAATFAVWDGSGNRVQEFPSGGRTPFDGTVPSGNPQGGVAARARQRFRGFDPTLDAPPATVTRSRTQGDSLRVECVRANAGPAPADWGVPGELPNFTQLYRRDGAFTCSSEADVSAVGMPSEYAPRANMHVCGVGKTLGNSCSGRLLVLSNDWGLSGSETNECDLNCRNSPYRQMVKNNFAAAFAKGPAFASAFAGGAPVEPFQFSYMSIDSNMTQNIPSEGWTSFITGGAGIASPASTGRTCFLGLACPP